MIATLPRPSRQHLFALPFLGAWVALFWPTFVWMHARFNAADSFYSHGWLVPAAGAWLVWQQRRYLAQLSIRSSFWGLALLVPSLLVHVVATWWDLHFLSGFAMLGVLTGLVWTVWGWPMVWALRFPLAFLVFMVPLPGVLLIAISFKMKLLAATLATHLVSFIGIPAVQAGSMIHVPGVSVIVDDTCSGLRSLLSLIALSILWTSLMGSAATRWHKLTIVAASIPIALVANMIRILVLVLLSAIYGPQIAESFIHYGSGVVVFGIALLALMWLTQRLQPCPVSIAPPSSR